MTDLRIQHYRALRGEIRESVVPSIWKKNLITNLAPIKVHYMDG